MQLEFYKYQGTGNDFVIIDNRSGNFPKNNTNLIAALCDRKFGIGADGLILIELHPDLDFRMVYYNADGRESTMCGNGGRCLVHFAHFLGIINRETTFEAIDGEHKAFLTAEGLISLKMKDVSEIKMMDGGVFLDTGSPHHVSIRENLDSIDIMKEGAGLRYGMYGQKGANINFVKQVKDAVFKVRTYERGVEAETLSCGTGVTAVALAMFFTGKTKSHQIKLITPGGELQVDFKTDATVYRDIYLTGPAILVFKGIWND